MRRRKLIKETAPQEKGSNGVSDKQIKQVTSDERRSSSNADQIGKAKGDRTKPTENSDKRDKAKPSQHSDEDG